nr:nucleoside-diphosphate kinase [uncultured Rhodoferax sp.]
MLLDESYGPAMPAGLTQMPQKAVLYAIETYFWEGWEDLVRIAGDSAKALLSTHSLVLLKPDALCTRKIETILQWLEVNGFSIIDCMSVEVSSHQTRALWRYQWNTARRDRKEALDALLAAAPSILLIIRSLQDVHLTAAQRFAQLKGPADAALQRPGDLRARLGTPTHLLNFVHSADEPSDVARELAILLPSAERRKVAQRMMQGDAIPAREVANLVSHLYDQVPHRQLDLREALTRVEDAVGTAGSVSQPRRERIANLIDRIRREEVASWRELFALLDECDVPYEPWDRITIAAFLANVAHEGVDFLIPSLQPVVIAPSRSGRT